MYPGGILGNYGIMVVKKMNDIFPIRLKKYFSIGCKYRMTADSVDVSPIIYIIGKIELL